MSIQQSDAKPLDDKHDEIAGAKPAPAIENQTVEMTGANPTPNSYPRTSDGGRNRHRDQCCQAEPLGQRDATMILVAFRHGLSVSELVDLRGIRSISMPVSARPQGQARDTFTHPIVGDEMRALRRLRRSRIRSLLSFSLPNAVRRSRQRALPDFWSALAWPRGSALKVHPTCFATPAFALAKQGHDTRALQAYLGHTNIQHTVLYTELAPGRFKNFWNSTASIASRGARPGGVGAAACAHTASGTAKPETESISQGSPLYFTRTLSRLSYQPDTSNAEKACADFAIDFSQTFRLRYRSDNKENDHGDQRRKPISPDTSAAAGAACHRQAGAAPQPQELATIRRGMAVYAASLQPKLTWRGWRQSRSPAPSAPST